MIGRRGDERRAAAPKVAAGVLFFDERDRVLLVRPSYKSYWDVPGGYVEEGESPLQACLREVGEELGLRVRIAGLLSVDWAPHANEGDKLLFLFDGGYLTAEQLADVTFPDGELSEIAFVDDSQLDELTIPRLVRRIRAATQARLRARPSYLEHGSEPV